MRSNDGTRTAGEVLIDQLVANGIRHMFCVPGESYIAALDAFYERDIAITVCRHESGAAIMAEACGKATGRPGICFVTRGPGASNAAAGVHIARQDSTPLILFVGQIARAMRERHEPAAEAPVERAAAGCIGRRKSMVAGGLCRAGALCRTLRASRRHHISARAFVRCRSPQLCRRPRHRPESEIAGAGESRGP